MRQFFASGGAIYLLNRRPRQHHLFSFFPFTPPSSCPAFRCFFFLFCFLAEGILSYMSLWALRFFVMNIARYILLFHIIVMMHSGKFLAASIVRGRSGYRFPSWTAQSRGSKLGKFRHPGKAAPRRTNALMATPAQNGQLNGKPCYPSSSPATLQVRSIYLRQVLWQSSQLGKSLCTR